MFLTREQVMSIGFKSVGENVLISDKAVFYRPERISIGNNVRIDDFCVLANHIILHNNIHMSIYSCLLSSSNALIEMQDFSGISIRSLVFTLTDDFTGLTMTNPTIPDKFKNVSEKSVTIGKHCIIGAGSIVFPGANIADGSCIGAMSFVHRSTQSWKVYFGNPAKPIANRKKDLLLLEQQYLKEQRTK